ncbi:hypothetical protein D3C87_1866530 [compost metagenome]
MEVTTFAQAIAQGAEHVAFITDAVNSFNATFSDEIKNDFHQHAFGEQAVARSGRFFDRVTRHASTRTLKPTDNQR